MTDDRAIRYTGITDYAAQARDDIYQTIDSLIRTRDAARTQADTDCVDTAIDVLAAAERMLDAAQDWYHYHMVTACGTDALNAKLEADVSALDRQARLMRAIAGLARDTHRRDTYHACIYAAETAEHTVSTLVDIKSIVAYSD